MKTLKQLLELKKPEVPTPSSPVEPDSVTSYVPKTKDEKRFMDKHVIKKTDDVNGNGDDHFRATNIKVHDRSKGHGYNPGEDQKVYESKTLKQVLGEKHLTPADINKPVAEETNDLYHVFAEDIRGDIQEVYELLDEAHKQIFIELIEAEDYDAVIEVTKEVLNG